MKQKVLILGNFIVFRIMETYVFVQWPRLWEELDFLLGEGGCYTFNLHKPSTKIKTTPMRRNVSTIGGK